MSQPRGGGGGAGACSCADAVEGPAMPAQRSRTAQRPTGHALLLVLVVMLHCAAAEEECVRAATMQCCSTQIPVFR